MKVFNVLLAIAAALLNADPAWSQAFPSKTFTILVSTSAGGPNDTMARVWAAQLRRKSGQSVVVDNRAGGAGVLAMTALTTAPADGHTVALGGNQIQTLLLRNVGYDPAKVTAVSMLAESPFTLVASNASNLKNYRDFITRAKSSSRLTLGFVPGVHELYMRALEQALGIDATLVPYKGGAPLEVALIAGEVDASLFSNIDRVKTGQVVAIVTSGDTRRPEIPDIPTLKELAIDYEPRSVVAVFARSDTPPELLAQLNRECVELVHSPEYTTILAEKLNMHPVGSTRAQAVKYLNAELEMLRAVAERAGLKPQ
jgi:tripartite-type tricarboxylate transporter receptor subunit TctC